MNSGVENPEHQDYNGVGSLQPMRMACLSCMAMCGNGVAIGMAIIPHRHRPILKVHQRGRTAWIVAVAGTTLRSIAGRRTATTSLQTTASTP